MYFSPCGKFLASFGECTIFIYDIKYGSVPVFTYKFKNGPSLSNWNECKIYWLPNERLLIKFYTTKTMIYVLNLKTKKIIHTFRDNQYIYINPVPGHNDLFFLQIRNAFKISDLLTLKTKFVKLICHGFYEKNYWHDFLLKGFYDPRLLIRIWAFI